MKTDITLDREVVYRLVHDDYSLEIDNVHPQQIAWVNNVMEDFAKAQKWLQETYKTQYKDTFGDPEEK